MVGAALTEDFSPSLRGSACGSHDNESLAPTLGTAPAPGKR
ncbi:MAG: hypothetical protein JWM80_3376, partial [Cyanobacteria bacterium RYN_339]|nr:hypothetical protein [Cyanobacteria bacterium RYN_339]